MTIPFTPPTDRKPDMSVRDRQAYRLAGAPLKEADGRRRYRRHTVRMDKSPEHADCMLPSVSTDGDEVVVYLPRSFWNCTSDVACETVCQAFRRMEDPSLPVYGPTTASYFRSDDFRRNRAHVLGSIGMSPHMSGFVRRTGTRMTRLESRFVAMMEGPLHFLGSLMRVRSIGMVPLSDDVRRPRLATYSDPYLHLVLYDRDVLDPVEDEAVCMVLMFRACAFIECYDLRRHRLDMGRFLLMLSLYPGYDRAMEMCDREGVRYPDWEREERRLLPCGTTRTS